MLQNFFKLDQPYTNFNQSRELEQHFRTSSSLENIQYRPSSIDVPQRTLFKEKTFKNVSFSKTNFRRMTFTECKFEDCLFIGATFAQVQFHRCNFINCNFYKCSFRQCYLDPRSMEFYSAFKKSHSNIMTELFHSLLVNAKSESQHRHAEYADIMFQRWLIAQRAYERKKKKISTNRYMWDWTISRAGDCIFGYGYRPLKFAVASLLFLLLCSLATHLLWPDLGLRTNCEAIGEGCFLNSIYFTVVVTTTLGFGDIVPTSVVGQIFASLLSVMGLARIMRHGARM